MMSRQRAHEQNRIALFMQVEGDGLPEVTRCLDSEEDTLWVASRKNLCYFLPETLGISFATDIEGK